MTCINISAILGCTGCSEFPKLVTWLICEFRVIYVVTSCVRLRLQLRVRKYSESWIDRALYFLATVQNVQWRKLKGLGENIHFWMSLSADTTEESTAEGTQEFPSNQCWGPPFPVYGGGEACFHSKESTWRPNLGSQRAIIKSKPRVSGYHKNQLNVYCWEASSPVPNQQEEIAPRDNTHLRLAGRTPIFLSIQNTEHLDSVHWDDPDSHKFHMNIVILSTNALRYRELRLAFRYLNKLKLENKIHEEFAIYVSHAITEFWRKL